VTDFVRPLTAVDRGPGTSPIESAATWNEYSVFGWSPEIVIVVFPPSVEPTFVEAPER
jgi:hypothetical protein